MQIYFAHATSLCGAVWRPVVSQLSDVDCVTWDFAGHGHGPVLELPVDWRVFSDQVLAETASGGIGVGHSMGAAALAMAELADPGRFRFLVLIEPIIFPGPHRRLEHPLSAVALKRKRVFGSRSEARANFATRGVFANWHPEALDGYVECGLVGDGPVELACDPEVEADIYRAGNSHDTWERLGEIDTPVLVLAGGDSDAVPPDTAREQATRFRRAGVEIVPGSGHFLPMERPEVVAERIRRLVETFD